MMLSQSTRLVERIASGLDARIKAKDLSLPARVLTWLNLAAICREVDDALCELPAPLPDDLQLHRAFFALAIGTGEWLRFELLEYGETREPIGLDDRAVDATLTSLQISFNGWHGEMSAERRVEILQQVFA